MTAAVDRRLAPWCAVYHVHDGMFRIASLQAGLRLEPDGSGGARFLLPTDAPGGASTCAADVARREVVRRFLRFGGAVGPPALAAWLAMEPPAARRWWAPIASEVVPLRLDGRPLWMHREDIDVAQAAPRPTAVRLLPPYDPLLEVADRELLVPDAAQRRLIWRASANPGVLVVAGEVAGVWRQRTAKGRLTVTVTAFGELSTARRRAVGAESGRVAAHLGAADAEVVYA